VRSFLILIVLFISATSYAQDLDCSKFRTGHYRYVDQDYAELLTVRTDSIQTDSYPAPMNFIATSRVKWLSDCTYEFEYFKFNDEKFSSLIGTKYVIEIIAIKGDTISCQKADDIKFKTAMDMVKVKD
jgi:hypothetical protein